jgi:hypothetical protein
MEASLFENFSWISKVIVTRENDDTSKFTSNHQNDSDSEVTSSPTMQFPTLHMLTTELKANDKKLLSLELKTAWNLSKDIRDSFKVLVEEFITSESKRMRLGIFLR